MTISFGKGQTMLQSDCQKYGSDGLKVSGIRGLTKPKLLSLLKILFKVFFYKWSWSTFDQCDIPSRNDVWNDHFTGTHQISLLFIERGLREELFASLRFSFGTYLRTNCGLHIDANLPTDHWSHAFMFVFPPLNLSKYLAGNCYKRILRFNRLNSSLYYNLRDVCFGTEKQKTKMCSQKSRCILRLD